MIGVYKITNKINGKIYIGQSKNVKRRWKEHVWDANKGKLYPIHNAIRKYGVTSFIFEVIEECSLEKLDSKEESYIALCNSIKSGYNILKGGNCFLHGEAHLAYGKHKSDEHKDKIRQKHLGILKPKNKSTKNGSFKVWSYFTPKNTYVLCDNITKRDWCIKQNCVKDAIYLSIHDSRPVLKGKLKGYQFFDYDYFGGGLADGILRKGKK